MSRSPDWRRLIRCAVCGKAVEVTFDDQIRLAREGWPSCCGQLMDCAAEPVSPRGPDDTSVEQQALPPGT